MERSDTISELAKALTKAQGSGVHPSVESAILRQMFPRRGRPGCQNAAIPLHKRLLSRIAFGASDCWHWLGPVNGFGYGRITYEGRMQMVHRLAYRAFKGNIPWGMSILHSCDNPSCINPDHLRPGTYSDNKKDCISRGRNRVSTVRGFAHHSTKVKEEWIPGMRHERESGKSYAKIAAKYGISTMAAWHALNGRFV